MLFPSAREYYQIDAALNVFQRHEAHRLARFGGMRPYSCDDACHAHLITRVSLRQLTGKVCHYLCERVHHRAERMIRDIQADEFFLPFQHLASVYFGGKARQGDLV